MRLKIVFAFLVSLLFMVVLNLSAGGDSGKALFVSKCGQCHKSGGEGPVFAPTKYASRQWERFFSRNKHKRKKDISGLINKSELEKIQDYLIDHAADSSQPEAAGLK